MSIKSSLQWIGALALAMAEIGAAQTSTDCNPMKSL